MILYILFSLNLYMGFDMLTMKIKDFNDHLDFLTKRANELGWI